jgi:hypothetical protein
MSLALTPINDAWSNQIQTKKKQPPKPDKRKDSKNPQPQNVYNSPHMQTKILNELGMLQPLEEHGVEEEPEQMPQRQLVQQTASSDSLNITLSKPFLVNMLRPYSNEYIEMIIMKCMSEQNNSTSQDLIDTVETIYLMVSILLVLVIIDIVFKMKTR